VLPFSESTSAGANDIRDSIDWRPPSLLSGWPSSSPVDAHVGDVMVFSIVVILGLVRLVIGSSEAVAKVTRESSGLILTKHTDDHHQVKHKMCIKAIQYYLQYYRENINI
jgi:hypothetical protein